MQYIQQQILEVIISLLFHRDWDIWEYVTAVEDLKLDPYCVPIPNAKDIKCQNFRQYIWLMVVLSEITEKGALKTDTPYTTAKNSNCARLRGHVSNSWAAVNSCLNLAPMTDAGYE